MNFIVRNFFYGVGLTTLWLMSQLSPETAQLRDLVALMHSSAFWQISGCVGAMLAGMDLVLSGRLVIPARPANIAKDVGPKAGAGRGQ